MSITLGALAPNFELPTTNGLIANHQLQGQPLLLAFFSMAFTPV
jgi:peroxiredoxin